MSDGVIEADPKSISAVNDQLISASTSMDTQIQNLTSELNYLMTQWTGEAATAYLTAQSEWNESMLTMHSLLAQITGLLGTISARYETTEAGVVSAAGG